MPKPRDFDVLVALIALILGNKILAFLGLWISVILLLGLTKLKWCELLGELIFTPLSAKCRYTDEHIMHGFDWFPYSFLGGFPQCFG